MDGEMETIVNEAYGIQLPRSANRTQITGTNADAEDDTSGLTVKAGHLRRKLKADCFALAVTPLDTSACEKVFNIAELVDGILLKLSMRDLLCGAQGVSRQWYVHIMSSPRIQEHLFLRPITPVSTVTSLVQ